MYHVITKKGDQKWIWIIMMLPFIGSLIYLYNTFYSRGNIDNIKEEVKSTINTNYKISKLEREVEFSDSFTNKIMLADEYLLVGNFEKANELYESCKNGVFENDIDLLLKLMKVNYLKKDFNRVIEYSQKILHKREFNDSMQKTYLAWSYYEVGKKEEALKHFEEGDSRYSNYEHRLEYARFLDQTGNHEQANAKLENLLKEINTMNSREKKVNRQAYRLIKKYHTQLAEKA